MRRPSAVALAARGAGTLTGAAEYSLTLDARASSGRIIDVAVREPGNPGRAGVQASLYLRPRWTRHVLTLFVPPGRPLESFELVFELGRDEGRVELQDVSLQEGVADAGWIREFEHGLVVVNPTRRRTTLDIPAGFRKIRGSQDPTHNDGAEAGRRIEVAPLDAYLLQRIARR